MTLRRTIRWESIDAPGLEHLQLNEWPDGIRIRSTVIGESEGQPFGIFYDIALDPDWTFRSLLLQTTTGVMTVLTADRAGGWFDSQSQPLPHLGGCVDIDISITPFTNTLPIRRARFETGRPQRFRMAHIPYGSFEPVVDEQIYTRLDDRRFRYAAADRSFLAELELDEDGLVTDYPGRFRRV